MTNLCTLCDIFITWKDRNLARYVSSVCVSVSVSLCLCVSVSVSLCVSMCLYVSLCVSMCLCVSMSVYQQ